MKKYIVLNKKVGETPLAALQAFRARHREYTDVPLSYAGRLDPMAEGKLLVLIGDECKKQKKYIELDKEYDIEVLLDVGSDTGDALGLVTYSGTETRVDQKVLRMTLEAERGTHERAYPAFSSKTVNGKPLFLHSLQRTVPYMEPPTHKETIHRIRVLASCGLSKETLEQRIHDFLSLVPKTDEPSKMLGADFRIKEVRAGWNELFAHVSARDFIVLTFRVTCGSGTYMRSLAGRIGEALGTKALALSIKRTKIGKYWGGWWLYQW